MLNFDVNMWVGLQPWAVANYRICRLPEAAIICEDELVQSALSIDIIFIPSDGSGEPSYNNAEVI